MGIRVDISIACDGWSRSGTTVPHSIPQEIQRIKDEYDELFRYSIRAVSTSVASHFCKHVVKTSMISKTFCKNLASNVLKGIATSCRAVTWEWIKNISLKVVPEIVKGVITFRFFGKTGLLNCLRSKAIQGASDLCKGAWNFCKASFQETLKQCTEADKYAMANLSFKSALKWSAAIEGFLWSASIGYQLYKYSNGDIEWEECREKIIIRSCEAVSSIGFTAAGAYIGTLICPGVGTTIGMVAGSLLGGYLGSWVGTWWCS